MPRYRLSRDVRALNAEALADEETRRKVSGQEDCADLLLDHLRTLAPDVPAPVRDWRFRTFRVDLAWPDQRLMVEVNGGLRRAGGGKHATSRDHQKVRQLVLAGYRVLVFTSTEVRRAPDMCLADIRAGLVCDILAGG